MTLEPSQRISASSVNNISALYRTSRQRPLTINAPVLGLEWRAPLASGDELGAQDSTQDTRWGWLGRVVTFTDSGPWPVAAIGLQTAGFILTAVTPLRVPFAR